MTAFLYITYAVHVLVSIFLILVVLLQQGKGADLAVFGGGGTQTAFGARGATQVIHRLTVGAFVAFIITTLGIGILQSKVRSGGSAVMTQEFEPEVPEAATAEGELAEEAATEAPAAAVETAAEEAPASDPVATESATTGGAESDPPVEAEGSD